LAVQAGALDLAPVIVATFLGGYLGDEARFAVARKYGAPRFTNWPRLSTLMVAASQLAERYGPLYIFLYRYPKGMRTIGALPVGLGHMKWPFFTALNAASAALWTTLLVGTGVIFGSQIQRAVESGWGAASVVLLALMAAAIWLAWRRMRNLPGAA
jgi:membrane protein DedA with SNARE-associated domain